MGLGQTAAAGNACCCSEVMLSLTGEPVFGNVTNFSTLCLLKSTPKGKLIALCSSIHLHLFMARLRKHSLLSSCGFLRSSTCRNRHSCSVAKDWFSSKGQLTSEQQHAFPETAVCSKFDLRVRRFEVRIRRSKPANRLLGRTRVRPYRSQPCQDSRVRNTFSKMLMVKGIIVSICKCASASSKVLPDDLIV